MMPLPCIRCIFLLLEYFEYTRTNVYVHAIAIVSAAVAEAVRVL